MILTNWLLIFFSSSYFNPIDTFFSFKYAYSGLRSLSIRAFNSPESVNKYNSINNTVWRLFNIEVLLENDPGKGYLDRIDITLYCISLLTVTIKYLYDLYYVIR